MSLALATIEVKLVGGESLLALLGPVLVAIAAIVAATLAAYTANRRHREQLEHDREMRDREHLRSVIDDAVEGATESVRALGRFAGSLAAAERQRPDFEAVLADRDASSDAKSAARATLGELRESLDKPMDEAHTLTMEMYVNGVRLGVRLGDEHPITALLDKLAGSHRSLYDNLCSGLEVNRTEEERSAEETHVETEDEPTHLGFLDACRDWFGAEAPAGGSASS